METHTNVKGNGVYIIISVILWKEMALFPNNTIRNLNSHLLGRRITRSNTNSSKIIFTIKLQYFDVLLSSWHNYITFDICHSHLQCVHKHFKGREQLRCLVFEVSKIKVLIYIIGYHCLLILCTFLLFLMSNTTILWRLVNMIVVIIKRWILKIG